MIALLDTAILIDLLRGYPPAGLWIASQRDLGISSMVWLEVLKGANNLRDQKATLKLLSFFQRVDVTPDDFAWAIQQTIDFRLSHNVDINDCLIAATSHRLQVPLYTPNLKHFLPILGALAQKPY